MNESRTNWDIFTDLGPFDGAGEKSDKGFAAESRGLRVETAETTGAAGVTLRRTVVRNVSDRPVTATCLLDVFDFGGGDFEVYTQANTWMDESRGAWQPLHTEVAARGGGMRTSFGAAPVLALWNVQKRRGRVFHLLSDAALRDVRVVVATARSRQKSVTVRPVLDPALGYEHAGRRDFGAAWMERGVEVETGIFTAAELRFHFTAPRDAPQGPQPPDCRP